jgi:uncharacterized protein with HEPN domain
MKLNPFSRIIHWISIYTNPESIWAILVKHIPLLKQEINMLIETKDKF